MKKDNNTPIPEYLRKRYKIDYDYVEELTEQEQIDGLWFMKRSLEELTGLRLVLEDVKDNVFTLFVYDETEADNYYQGEILATDLELEDFFNEMDGLLTIAIAAHQKGKKQEQQNATLFPT